MHDRIDVIEVGFFGPPGELSPTDRAAVATAIAAGDALTAAIADVAEAVKAAQEARDEITGLQVSTGDPGTAATWDAEAGTLTVPRGAKGDDGLSAYEQAVAAGFIGDLTAWLASLNGAPGADGADGAAGADGDSGPPGPSAYQLAVAAGFGGTEAEWRASLKGDPGTSIAGIVLTQAAYDALSTGEKSDPAKLYLITG